MDLNSVGFQKHTFLLKRPQPCKMSPIFQTSVVFWKFLAAKVRFLILDHFCIPLTFNVFQFSWKNALKAKKRNCKKDIKTKWEKEWLSNKERSCYLRFWEILSSPRILLRICEGLWDALHYTLLEDLSHKILTKTQEGEGVRREKMGLES